MDTKLKKTHRLTVFIIALCIIVPSLLITALYPQMENAAIERKQEYETREIEWAEEQTESSRYSRELDSSFDNMAAEAAYYIYGSLLREASDAQVNMTALDEYGWINDYYTIREGTFFYAEMTKTDTAITSGQEEHPETEEVSDQEKQAEIVQMPDHESEYSQEAMTETHIAAAKPGSYGTTNLNEELVELLDMSEEEVMQELSNMDGIGFLQIEFNQYGELTDVRCHMQDDVRVEDNLYSSIKQSMEQYYANAEWIRGNMDHTLDPNEMVPKDFRIIFVLRDDGYFVYDLFPSDYSYIDIQSLYLDTGAWVPVIFAAIFVALAALLLPFFKKLDTGWEKIFCIPFEFILILIGCGAAGAFGMFMAMSESTMSNLNAFTEYNAPISLIGYELSNEFIYGVLLVLNFLGWSLCFLAEYIVFASFRQFLCGPIHYMKERILCIRMFRWLKRQGIRFYHYVVDIDINKKLHSGIIKIILVNFAVLALLCCLWFMGIFGLILYSVALYVLMKKYGEKLQRQYHSLLHAANQMAEGNLKIQIDEDLGVLNPLGEELEKVQQGFSKAVAEEAKSQNMRTELITNVSHDLKTPLTAIITYVELLKEENITDEERKNYIKTIDQKSQRLKVLIDDLFEVSKANSGSIQMNFMDVDVVNLMKQVRLEMEEKIKDSNLSFRWNLPEEKGMLSLDGQKTYRVFENLLNNILKYSMPHSRVYVDILNQPTQVEILFRNISAVELSADPQHLTERFVRGDDARKTEGSGLGLAIVKSFVELQNGKLDISVDGDLFKVSIIWMKQ